MNTLKPRIKYYLSQSTGEPVKIKDMDSRYLFNARNVVKRTIITKLDKNGIDLVDEGINQPLYDALNEELKTRPVNEYQKPIYILK